MAVAAKLLWVEEPSGDTECHVKEAQTSRENKKSFID